MKHAEITNVITNSFGTYVIYKLITTFYDDLRTSKHIEFLSFAGYYIISSTLFLLVRIPLVLMVSNVVLFFLLSLNYYSSFKRRILLSFFIIMILVCIEVFVSVVFGYIKIPFLKGSKFDSIIGLFSVRIFSMLIASIISNLKNIKKDIPVPNFYWFSIIFISVSSFFLLVAILNYNNFNKIIALLIVCVILGINFIVIFLYDNLCNAFAMKAETQLLIQQNKAYEKQFELIQQSLNAMSLLRHDMKNHFIVLKGLHSADDTTAFDAYMDTMISSSDNANQRSKSDNYAIDSILNFKMQEAIDMGIKPEMEISVPQEIELPTFDVTVILGNLVDNAITALKECSSNKFLSVKVKYNKDNLIITIINSFNGEIKEKNGKYLTLKSDKNNHGLGIKSVEEILKKNGGHLSIQYDKKSFTATVFLPI